MITRVSLIEAAWFARRLLRLCPDGQPQELRALTHMLLNRRRMLWSWEEESLPMEPPFPIVAEPVVGVPPMLASGSPPARTVAPTRHSSRDRVFLNALLSSYEALRRPDNDPTKGALNYQHHEHPPYWDDHARATALIGRYLFYR